MRLQHKYLLEAKTTLFIYYLELDITQTIEGIEGDNVTLYCITNSPLVMSRDLQVEVNSVELPTSTRIYTSEINSTHREVVLYNLDRRPFVNFNESGDHGMPLSCGFCELRSSMS